MTNTEVNELIRKHKIARQGDNLAIPPTSAAKAALDRIKALKPEIMAELVRREEAEAAAKAAKEAARVEEARAIRAGERKIEVSWTDGEYLQAYQVYGEAAKALEEIGAARWIDGWGYMVESEIVKALGKEFALAQAAEFLRPAREARESEEKARNDERQAKFARACESGQKVILRSWMEDCNDPREECSTDHVTEYAMPDGTTRRERQHTW